jgi:transposase-like protein
MYPSDHHSDRVGKSHVQLETVRVSIGQRIREGMRVLLEQILFEDLTQQIPPVGKIKQVHVPRDRQNECLPQVFDRYQRMTDSVS